MEDLSYPACTRELYESEIIGEAVLFTLVREAKNPRDHYHFATLLQLETETKAKLRPLLYKHGISLDEEIDESLLDVVVGTYRDNSWQEFTALIVSGEEDFVARFEAIARAGDEADSEILESMVRHEASILRWATMERDGNTDGSLNDVTAQLSYPLPVMS